MQSPGALRATAALDKLLPDPRLPHHSQASAVADLASLILFGTSAIPIRLKVLLDCLFAHSSEAEVSQLLRRLGWTEDDFSRGYMLKVSMPLVCFPACDSLHLSLCRRMLL